MDGKLTIGILAMQGAVSKHAEMLKKTSVNPMEIRSANELNRCDGLIIPGGESTTIYQQLQRLELEAPLIHFAQSHPVFGTCAGMILMVKLKLIDLKIERNGFGRQLQSFSAPLNFKNHRLEGFFIRAPRITNVSSSVETLISYDGEPVFVQQNHHLACSFHPELTEDPSIHKYFIQLCKQ